MIHPDVSPYRFDHNSVKNGSIDVYVASYSLLIKRTEYLDPTNAIGQSRILAFFDQNFQSDFSNQSIFIVPFTYNLWLGFIIVWFVCLLSFIIFNLYEADSSMGDIIFHCITVTLQRGTFLNFFYNSTRITTVVLSFTIVVLMASYSGIMTSISAVSRYTIHSIEALVASNYKILLEFGYNTNASSIKYMLEALMHIPTVVTLMKKAEKSNFVFQSFENAIMQVNNSPSTYIIDEETGINFITEQLGGLPCTWTKLPVFNLRYPWVMYLKKNAPYRHAINTGLLKIKETGILQVLRKRWITQPSDACFSGNDFSFKSITYPQVSSAFTVLLLVMFIVCPVLFLLEKVYAFCSHHRRQ
ncbi:unnamed protein product [Orchesella dallaii]